GADYTCFVQVIPGFVIESGSNNNVFKFTVSGNTYFVTHDQLFTSLNTNDNTTNKDCNGNPLVTVKENKITLEQGKNYVFTITVKKTGVDVTASLVPWVNVTGEGEATNDYVKINIKDAEANACSHFDLYRLNDDLNDIYAPETGPGTGENWEQKYNWYGNYTQKAEKTKNGETNVWDTEWFWESNKTFYHFRTVNEGMVLYGNTGDDPNTTNDYFKIFGGPIQDYSEGVTKIRTAAFMDEDNNGVDDGTYVNDYHWGAPYKTGQSMKYDVQYGWSAAADKDGQIYPAIGSTKHTINMIEHHMMANIRIILKTMKDETAGKKLHVGGVHLKGSTIKLTRLYHEGTVEMGRGLVNVAGTTRDTLMTAPSSDSDASYYADENDHTVSKQYTFRVVPQSLVRNSGANLSDYVGLTITTPDPEMNQYYVIKKLSEITATSTTAGNQTQGQVITRWYPGHDYTYTINISKTGIDAITCSVVEWNKVEGSDFDLGLED
ncbi:MAG: fimbrillin family protein, partial [Candidatus Cryptobacteroides sp.]